MGLAAISYDSQAVLADFAKRKGIAFPLLSDHESNVIRAYGVANRNFHKNTQINVDREEITENTFDNTPVYGLAYPSIFVVDPSGKIEWRTVSENAEFRLTGAAILERSIDYVSSDNRISVTNGKIGVTLTVSNSSIGLANRVILGVDLNIPAGLHVYSPGVKNGFYGIDWQMDNSKCWHVLPAAYPTAKMLKVAFSKEDLPVYEQSIRITRELVVEPLIKPSDPTVYQAFCQFCLDKQSNVVAKGTLKYQACSDRECFPPVSLPLEWKMKFIPPDRQRVPDELRREFE